MISLGQKIKSKESENYENLQTFLKELKEKQENLKRNRSENLCHTAKLNNMKIKVTSLLESKRFQVDLERQNLILRKNQDQEKIENQLMQCTTCDSIFYYQTICYCSKPMCCKKIENPHSENLAVGAPITGMVLALEKNILDPSTSENPRMENLTVGEPNTGIVPILEKMKPPTNTSENPHLEKLDDFCDDAMHYLNHFFWQLVNRNFKFPI